MVSRRKILSRSTDDLNLEGPVANEPEEEDVWFNKDKLYKVRIKLIKFEISIDLRTLMKIA